MVMHNENSKQQNKRTHRETKTQAWRESLRMCTRLDRFARYARKAQIVHSTRKSKSIEYILKTIRNRSSKSLKICVQGWNWATRATKWLTWHTHDHAQTKKTRKIAKRAHRETKKSAWRQSLRMCMRLDRLARYARFARLRASLAKHR